MVFSCEVYMLAMNEKKISDKLKRKLRPIMRNHGLAKFGDSLSNFIYSLAKTRMLQKPTGERVFDKALAEAIKLANLRSLMPSSSSSGDIGDGAEALVGYAYLNEILTVEEMVAIIMPSIKELSEEQELTRKNEKEAMVKSFECLLNEILSRINLVE